MSRADLRSRAALPVLAVAFLLIAAAAAEARVLASGFLMSSNAVRVGCRVLNVGSTPAIITDARIVTDGGTVVTDFDTCEGTLQPGKSCSVTGPGNLLAGVVKVSGPTKNLRGVCLLLAPGNNVLATTEMR